DYLLILIFVLIFVDFDEISSLLKPLLGGALFSSGTHIILVSAVLSQLISNVPATILLINHVPPARWVSLAVGVNLGGIGLLTGSMANIIAVRLGGLDARAYHRVAVPLFALLLIIVLVLSGFGLLSP
ncbi:MAG: hypothetical protein F7C34_03245, partial [Desulfurococcales archaeon]|nr:hypothetical protein [Desulfurococcales archaeon]